MSKAVIYQKAVAVVLAILAPKYVEVVGWSYEMVCQLHFDIIRREDGRRCSCPST